MVTANRGTLLKCDASTMQYLLYIDSTERRFIIETLDEEHLFIVPDTKIMDFIHQKIEEWSEKNTYQHIAE